MALARCDICGRPRGRNGNVYSQVPREPVGHPRSGVICGGGECKRPGLVWLRGEEEHSYSMGQRIFQIPNAAVKLCVR
jgi:hypothetical protein